MRIQRKILFTGTSGVCKKEYLTKMFGSPPFSIEDNAKASPSENPIWMDRRPERRLGRIRDAWEKGKRRKSITFHCVWWTPGGFLYDQLQMADIIRKEVKPEYLVVLINNITDARWYLQYKSEAGDKIASQIGFRDIIIWRGNEINSSLHLAQRIWPKDFKNRFYVVATGHSKETIRDLVNTNKPRAYVAFPVRKLTDPEQIQKVRDEFIPLVSKLCVTFNPYAIYEKELEKLLSNPNPERVAEVYTSDLLPKSNFFGDPFFPRDNKPKWFSITLWEIAQVIRDINAQIVERDRMMVQQSDFVVAYRPLLSEGAQRELRWSLDLNSEAYAYVPESDREEWEKISVPLFEEDLRHIRTVDSLSNLEAELKKAKRKKKKE